MAVIVIARHSGLFGLYAWEGIWPTGTIFYWRHTSVPSTACYSLNTGIMFTIYGLNHKCSSAEGLLRCGLWSSQSVVWSELKNRFSISDSY